MSNKKQNEAQQRLQEIVDYLNDKKYPHKSLALIKAIASGWTILEKETA